MMRVFQEELWLFIFQSLHMHSLGVLRWTVVPAACVQHQPEKEEVKLSRSRLQMMLLYTVVQIARHCPPFHTLVRLVVG